MKENDFRAVLRGFGTRPLIWTACLALVWMISAPAMAHGNEVHDRKAAEIAVEVTTGDTSPESGNSVPDHAMPDMPGEQEHGHAGTTAHDAMPEEMAHDHSAHGPNEVLLESGLGRLLVWLGKFHPAAVHFPIAMLLGAALAELLSLRFKSEFFHNAARYSLWLGALGALGAASLGWLYGGFRVADEESLLTFHRWNGTGIAALALLTLWLSEGSIRAQTLRTRTSRLSLYRTVLFATAVLVAINGYIGGRMVYGPEQHQWPMPATEDSHEMHSALQRNTVKTVFTEIELRSLV